MKIARCAVIWVIFVIVLAGCKPLDGDRVIATAIVTPDPTFTFDDIQVIPYEHLHDSYSDGMELHVQDRKTQKILATHHFSTTPMGHLILSPGKTQLAFTQIAGDTVTIWDYVKDTSKTLQVGPKGIAATPSQIAFSPDGKFLLVDLCNMEINHARGCEIISVTELASGLTKIMPQFLLRQNFDHLTADNHSLVISGCTQYADAVLGICDTTKMTTMQIDLITLQPVSPLRQTF